jgi:hypothetical protein
LREAKIVPEVAENCLPQARHFHLRRVAMKYGSQQPQSEQSFPARLRKADRRERLERLERLVVGHAVDVFQIEGPGGGGKEEVGGHLIDLSYLSFSLHICKACS